MGHIDIGSERRAVFVRGGAVGDALRVDIDPRTRPARGVIVEIVRAGETRVAPPCPYAHRCGGCDWMHVSHEGQLVAHEAHVRSAVGDVAIETHAAEQRLRYRVRARLHASGEIVGPNAARSHTPIPVEACIVLHPVLDAARERLAHLLEGARGRGEVGLGLGHGGRAVLELRYTELPPSFFARLEAQHREGLWDGARVWLQGARAPAVIGDPTPWVQGPDDRPLRLAPGGFSQAHAEINRALARHVAAHAGGERILELYAGAGNFTVLLAKIAKVRAIESDEQACEAARKNLIDRKLEAKVTCADAAAFAVPGGVDTVVLDPPRTGARAVCAHLATSRVRRIVYVSCDPASLKRDLALLLGRFEIRKVDLFEMFPHTSHIETVVVLDRKRA